MSLNILSIEEEPQMEISYVPLSQTEEVEPDPELPDDFAVQADIDVLQASATALESIGIRIACEGMDLSTARELEKHAPGFMRQNGGHNAFTSSPSLEGLADAVKTVKDKFVSIIKRLRAFISRLYKQFRDWLKLKLTKPDSYKYGETCEAWLAAHESGEAIKYMASLPEDPQEAADEIARFADGDTKAFALALANQMKSLIQRADVLEKAMTSNPTQYRIVRGDVSIKELFQRDADSSIRAILKKASAVADKAMKTRNSEEFMTVLTEINAVSEEMNEFEKGTIVNDTFSKEFGDDAKPVKIDKLYENIEKAIAEFVSVDVQQLVGYMNDSLEDIIRISDETKIEDILEMMPEDIPAEKQTQYAQLIASLYRRISKLGADVLRLWKVRFNAIESINTVTKALMGLVEGMEVAVTAATNSLSTEEQKQQIYKAFAHRGFTIDYRQAA